MHFLKSIDSSTIVKIPAVTNVNDLNAQSTRKSFCLPPTDDYEETIWFEFSV